MPTDSTSKSRAFRVTREFATYKGEKPAQSKTLQNLAPKAGQPAAAAVASGAASQQQQQQQGGSWAPSTATKRALVASGRKSLPKPALRLAETIAREAAPRVVRTTHAADDAALALGVAIGAVEASAAKRSVLIVTSDAAGPLAQGIADKIGAIGGAQAASLCTCLAAPGAAAPAAIAAGAVVVGPADVVRAAKLRSGFAVCVLVATGANLDALRGVAKATSEHARFVVIAPSVKIATSVTVYGASAASEAQAQQQQGDKKDSGAASLAAAVAAAPTGKTLRAVEMNYFVAHGLAKFNLLQALVNNSGASKRILVRCATKEVASFYCDVLLATNANATVLTDVEDDAAFDESDASDAASDAGPSDGAEAPAPVMEAPLPGLPAAHHLRTVVQQFEAAKGGCVLLTAFGLTSPKAEVIFELDPPASIAGFVAAVMDASHDDAKAETHIMVLDPSNHEAVVTAVKHAARALIAANPAAAATDAAAAPAAAKKKARTEAQTDADGSPAAVAWRFKRLPNLSASAGVLTGNKLRSLGKKLFTINNKGFQAYRALVHYYALLRPVEVFDVYRLNLDKVAEQFGLEDTPLLDLRTKSNPFRPKEDYGKLAALRERRDRRDFRQFAADNLHPEAADEEEA